jgi:hypothetical protein
LIISCYENKKCVSVQVPECFSEEKAKFPSFPLFQRGDLTKRKEYPG